MLPYVPKVLDLGHRLMLDKETLHHLGVVVHGG